MRSRWDDHRLAALGNGAGSRSQTSDGSDPMAFPPLGADVGVVATDAGPTRARSLAFSASSAAIRSDCCEALSMDAASFRFRRGLARRSAGKFFTL